MRRTPWLSLKARRDHDVSQNIDALLRNNQALCAWQILDMGCGPGRLICATFKAMGHVPVGLDGCEKLFRTWPGRNSGCESAAGFSRTAILPPSAFDAFSPTPPCFTFPARSCLALYGSLHQSLEAGGVLDSAPTREVKDQERLGPVIAYAAIYRLRNLAGILCRQRGFCRD